MLGFVVVGCFFDQQAVNKSIDIIENEVIIEEAKTFRQKDKFYGKRVDGETKWLAAGFHRLTAFKQLGQDEVRPGTRHDAIDFACIDNTTHGLLRSNKGKRAMANELGLARQKVSNWRHNDTVFTARFNAERQVAWSTHRERLRSLISSGRFLALDLERERIRRASAVHILKSVDLYDQEHETVEAD